MFSYINCLIKILLLNIYSGGLQFQNCNCHRKPKLNKFIFYISLLVIKIQMQHLIPIFSLNIEKRQLKYITCLVEKNLEN